MTTLLTAIYDQLAEQGLYLKACGMTQDPDAAWNVKTGSDGKRKSTYGYKAHINVSEEELINALAYTAGNVHDSKHFTILLKGNESAVYAGQYLSKRNAHGLALRARY